MKTTERKFALSYPYEYIPADSECYNSLDEAKKALNSIPHDGLRIYERIEDFWIERPDEEAIRAALQEGKRVTLGNRDVALFGTRIVVSFKTGRGAATFAHVSVEELSEAVITE